MVEGTERHKGTYTITSLIESSEFSIRYPPSDEWLVDVNYSGRLETTSSYFFIEGIGAYYVDFRLWLEEEAQLF